MSKIPVVPPTVLLVEGDRSLRRTLFLALKRAGFEITEAVSGGEALKALEEHLLSAVVLDVDLPDGLGGDVCNRLRQMEQEGDKFPVWVVISALDPDEVTRQYGPLDCPLLPKPFNPWDLIRMLESLLSAGDRPH